MCNTSSVTAFTTGSHLMKINEKRLWSIQQTTMRKVTQQSAVAEEAYFEEWEELNGGCKFLHPKNKDDAKAVVHFLGGAFVSPQPTIAYRYVLEQLVKLGYAVVATPFAVDFDYTKPAGDINDKFTIAHDELVDRGYGSLPLLSMGHSLGALMHVLLACEFPEDYVDKVAGAALISYNNKSVDGAIPGFKEVFVPALGPLEPLTRDPKVVDSISQLQEVRSTGFNAARIVAKNVQDRLGLKDGESLIPGVKPIALKVLDDLEAAAQLVDQLPDVISSIAQGASEFEPTPAEMREKVASSYTLSSPLVIKFDDDFIDESDALLDILPKAKGVNAKFEVLRGSHVTPLAIDPNAPSTPMLPIPVVLADGRSALLADADALVSVLDDYFTGSILSDNSSTTPDIISSESPTLDEEE